MARSFPAVAAMSANLGWTGLKAAADISAAFQAVRKGAGTSEEAATNLKNVLQKISSPETRKKFKSFGVDIDKMLTAGKKKGESPIDTLITAMDLAEKKGAKIGDVFQDQQVQLGLSALRQHRAEYRRIREEAMKANGITEEDFKRRQQTALGAQMRWQASMENLNISLGSSLLPLINDLLDKIIPVIDAIGKWAEANPELARTAVTVTAALIGFRIAAIGVRTAALFAKGGVLELASSLLGIGRFGGKLGKGLVSPFVGFGRALGRTRRDMKMVNAMATTGLFSPGQVIGGNIAAIGRNMLGMLNPLRLAGAAFRMVGVALRFAFIGTGIGAIVAGIAAAGTWIYNNWSGLSSMFSSFASTLQSRFPGAASAVGWVVDKVKALWNWVSDLLGPMNATEGAWKGWGTSAANAVADVVDWIASVPGRVSAKAAEWTAAFTDLASKGWNAIKDYDWIGLGKAIVQGIIDGIAAMGAALVAKAGQIASDAAASFKNMMPSWLGGGPSSAPAPASTGPQGARANGGPIRSGGSYLVGERGPELITAGRDGYVHNANDTRRMLGGGGSNGDGGNSSLTWSGNVVINGNASKEDADAIAERIMQKLSDLAWTGQQSLAADIG